MKDDVLRRLGRYQSTFGTFTAGQKVVAILGTGALLLAGVLVFRWVSQPKYSPVFSNLSSQDASAVIDQLDASGVQYKITNGGSTVMVPKNDVYKTRIDLSGKGLPSSSGGGYSLLDNQDLSTSQFKEQTDFKRAMEGELATTIEAMNGVQTAVVHLALPPKQVFADKQDPATASVLISTSAGSTLDPQQVQAVVHLVAASVDGLDPAKVTVADSTGKLLSTQGGIDGTGVGSRDQYVNDYQNAMIGRVQSMLDQVLGTGNSQVQVTADLDFDKAVIESKNYRAPTPPGLELSTDANEEKYSGTAANGAGAGGVVGPDGQMDPATEGVAGQTPKYTKKSRVSDNAVDTTVEHRETAPGSLKSLHIGVALDRTAAANNNPQEIEQLIRSAVGIQPKRGDTVRVSVLPFDRSAQTATAKALAAESAAAAKASRMDLYRNIGLAVLVLLGALLAWLTARKRAKKREQATTYVVEQLRSDALRREEAALPSPASAVLSLEGAPRSPHEEMRDELVALIENQPEDVASLLRGWLVES